MEGEVQEINNVHSESNSSNVEVLDVIPVQLVDNGSYQTFKTVENAQRTKYYKQTYRRAWEQMPDFAGNNLRVFSNTMVQYLNFRMVDWR